MSKNVLRFAAAALLLTVLSLPAHAQFGKNKITYHAFDWQVYHAPHFDIHYYPAEEPFLEDVISYAESAYLKISEDLDHELRIRVPLIIYKTHGEFLRTNVSLVELPQGVGAFAEPVQYRIVLPIDLPADKLYQLIAHELTHIFEYSLFFDGYLGRALRSRAPAWLIEGLASYLGEDEDALDQMVIRDAVVNGSLPSISVLEQPTFLAYRYGHAIFDFIEQEFGLEGLRNFLFEFKKVLLTGNVSKALKESFGYEIEEFDRRFTRYLRKKYYPILLEKNAPEEYGTEIGFKKPRTYTFSPTISPSGELVATLGLKKLEVDLFVLSAEDGEVVNNLTKGWTNRYEYLSTEVFEAKRDLSWSPIADEVAAFVREQNGWPLVIFDALKGKIVEYIKLENIYECASPAYSPDGRRIAFEGNRDGIVDIFEIDLETREIRNLTQDAFFDANPWYSPDGRSLLYNRRIGAHWKIFSVELDDASRKTQLTFGPSSDMAPSYSRDGASIFFASNRGTTDVFNIYGLDLATGDLAQYTDVVGGCFAPVEMAERDGEPYLVFQSYYEGTYRLYRAPLREPEKLIAADEHMSDVTEVEPFYPPLRLKVDDKESNPYKIRWDVEAPSMAVGVADDGTLLASGAVTFSDRLGNQRLNLTATTVSDYATIQATYLNTKRRFTWGAQAIDYRDFIYLSDASGAFIQRTEYNYTAANMFFSYPFSRNYRVETTAGAADISQLQPYYNSFTGEYFFDSADLTVAQAGAALVGDTTRFQSFGPLQGKRFRLGVEYATQLGGDTPTGSKESLVQYNADFRFYKQITRRSLFAWRIASVYSEGDLQNTYGFGGLNQLRGWDYRTFNGSRLAWSNLEFRFPLVDEMRFPILNLVQIRGFFFLDVGGAWFVDDLFYDPEVRAIRVFPDGTPVKFRWWDSDEDRLLDGRASYGAGFHFFFIGGLQFNWAFIHRLPYTQYLYTTPGIVAMDGDQPLTIEVDEGGTRTEFYITFDF